MPEPIRFYMDEHVPTAIAQGLRRRGVDVLTVQYAPQQMPIGAVIRGLMLIVEVLEPGDMIDHLEYI